ncbi:MAG: pseudouridine synthase [Balneolales bacterium]|nr:pseudouridine synthase [Balneolales bacterium]
MPVRLNKFISDAGICSRREADRKIKNGHVRVNGRAAQIGDMVSETDRILVSGNPVEMRSQHVYLAYNKPIGVTSTTDRTDPDNILKAVGYHGGRVFPVGRLDKDSEGLILLTNDGDIVNKILRASNKHDKEYIVSVDKPVTPDFIRQMAEGVSILGVMTRKCTVEEINPHTIRIILNQGMNRQIRRMCKALGYSVTRLQRIRVMDINLSGIETGSWRFLTESEKDSLLQAVAGSRKEAFKRPARKQSTSGESGSSSGSGAHHHKKKKADGSDKADSENSAKGKKRTSKNRSADKTSGSNKKGSEGTRRKTTARSSATKRTTSKSGKNTGRKAANSSIKSTGKPKRTGSKTKK